MSSASSQYSHPEASAAPSGSSVFDTIRLPNGKTRTTVSVREATAPDGVLVVSSVVFRSPSGLVVVERDSSESPPGRRSTQSSEFRLYSNSHVLEAPPDVRMTSTRVSEPATGRDTRQTVCGVPSAPYRPFVFGSTCDGA